MTIKRRPGRPEKRFCPRMHDKNIVGRTGTSGHGMCRQCFKDREKRIREEFRAKNPDQRLRQFCKNGHDTHITGRDLKANCVACRAPYHAAYREKNRERLTAGSVARRKKVREEVRAYRAEKGCKDCGIKDPRILHFDHLGNKNFTIGSGIGVARTRLWAEIAKCEVVCSNCHMIRTWERSH